MLKEKEVWRKDSTEEESYNWKTRRNSDKETLKIIDYNSFLRSC